MGHDCRYCICVPCYPWEEGVHNFRHQGREDACDCTRCARERPLSAPPASANAGGDRPG